MYCELVRASALIAMAAVAWRSIAALAAGRARASVDANAAKAVSAAMMMSATTLLSRSYDFFHFATQRWYTNQPLRSIAFFFSLRFARFASNVLYHFSCVLLTAVVIANKSYATY